MNAVPIDEAAVHRELDQLESGAGALGPGPLEPEPDPPPPPPMDWTIAAGALVLVLDRVVAPNWALEDAEKGLLHEQLKVTLAAFFPSINIDPRVQALLALGGVIASIAQSRIDLSTGKVKPLRAPKPAEDDGQRPLQFGAAQDRAPS